MRVARPGDNAIDAELADFCESEHGRLVGLLTLTTGDRTVAEELAQEALVRLCDHWSEVRQMQHRRAWLRRVALNLATSRFRRWQAERRANQRHGMPDDVDEDQADAIAVRSAVAALPPRQRTAVVLRYFVGLDVAATAAEMQCAQGTVKSLTHRAVTQLRSQLLDPEEIRS